MASTLTYSYTQSFFSFFVFKQFFGGFVAGDDFFGGFVPLQDKMKSIALKEREQLTARRARLSWGR